MYKVFLHLADIDSPAAAIREHPLSLRSRIPGAVAVRVPEANEIKEHGLETIELLRGFTTGAVFSAELRTLEHSIRAYQDGFEVGTGPGIGSPYLEEREQAVANNIAELALSRSILAIYGDDHVSKSMRNDGGPQRNQMLWPMAARLEQSGVGVARGVLISFTGGFDTKNACAILLQVKEKRYPGRPPVHAYFFQQTFNRPQQSPEKQKKRANLLGSGEDCQMPSSV